MSIIEWIRRELQPAPHTSDSFIYDDMASQSGRSLPVIYQPFDPGKRAHWRDRGALFDYLLASGGEGSRLLDVGPGDGWPSLFLARYARAVVGVDASARRARVCAANASRLGRTGARFVHVAPIQTGGPAVALPFPAGAFDGATAASSIEQTPDPRATLREVARVLRPGGRLRLGYEALAGYRDGREQELWLWPAGDGESRRESRLLLYDRRIEEETVVQYALTVARPAAEVASALGMDGHRAPLAAVTLAAFQRLAPAVRDARVCTTVHPSARTWIALLRAAGFRRVEATHSGASFAGRLFDALPPGRRPHTLAGVEELLRPLIAVVISMPAPLRLNPMLTAVR